MNYCEFDVDHGPLIEYPENMIAPDGTRIREVHTRDYRQCGEPARFKIDMGNGSYFWACAFHHDEVNGDHGEGSFKVPEACFGRYNRVGDDDGLAQETATKSSPQRD